MPETGFQIENPMKPASILLLERTASRNLDKSDHFSSSSDHTIVDISFGLVIESAVQLRHHQTVSRRQDHGKDPEVFSGSSEVFERSSRRRRSDSGCANGNGPEPAGSGAAGRGGPAPAAWRRNRNSAGSRRFDSGPVRLRLYGRGHQVARHRIHLLESGIQFPGPARVGDQLRGKSETGIPHLLS